MFSCSQENFVVLFSLWWMSVFSFFSFYGGKHGLPHLQMPAPTIMNTDEYLTISSLLWWTCIHLISWPTVLSCQGMRGNLTKHLLLLTNLQKQKCIKIFLTTLLPTEAPAGGFIPTKIKCIKVSCHLLYLWALLGAVLVEKWYVNFFKKKLSDCRNYHYRGSKFAPCQHHANCNESKSCVGSLHLLISFYTIFITAGKASQKKSLYKTKEIKCYPSFVQPIGQRCIVTAPMNHSSSGFLVLLKRNILPTYYDYIFHNCYAPLARFFF